MNLTYNTQEQIKLFYNVSKWKNITYSDKIWNEFLADDKNQYYSDFLPLYLLTIDKINDLNNFSIILSLDGAYGLLIFFNKFRKPVSKIKILIEKSLSLFVPIEWEENVIFFSKNQDRNQQKTFTVVNIARNTFKELNTGLDAVFLKHSNCRMKYNITHGITASGFLNKITGHRELEFKSHLSDFDNYKFISCEYPIFQSISNYEIMYNKSKMKENDLELFENYFVTIEKPDSSSFLFKNIVNENQLFFKNLRKNEISSKDFYNTKGPKINFISLDLQNLAYEILH